MGGTTPEPKITSAAAQWLAPDRPVECFTPSQFLDPARRHGELAKVIDQTAASTESTMEKMVIFLPAQQRRSFEPEPEEAPVTPDKPQNVTLNVDAGTQGWVEKPNDWSTPDWNGRQWGWQCAREKYSCNAAWGSRGPSDKPATWKYSTCKGDYWDSDAGRTGSKEYNSDQTKSYHKPPPQSWNSWWGEWISDPANTAYRNRWWAGADAEISVVPDAEAGEVCATLEPETPGEDSVIPPATLGDAALKRFYSRTLLLQCMCAIQCQGRMDAPEFEKFHLVDRRGDAAVYSLKPKPSAVESDPDTSGSEDCCFTEGRSKSRAKSTSQRQNFNSDNTSNPLQRNASAPEGSVANVNLVTSHPGPPAVAQNALPSRQASEGDLDPTENTCGVLGCRILRRSPMSADDSAASTVTSSGEVFMGCRFLGHASKPNVTDHENSPRFFKPDAALQTGQTFIALGVKSRTVLKRPQAPSRSDHFARPADRETGISIEKDILPGCRFLPRGGSATDTAEIAVDAKKRPPTAASTVEGCNISHSPVLSNLPFGRIILQRQAAKAQEIHSEGEENGQSQVPPQLPLFIGLDLESDPIKQDVISHRNSAVIANVVDQFGTQLREFFGLEFHPPPPNGCCFTTGSFRWSRPLHVTTFYLAGESRPSAAAQRSMELEGSLWSVKLTHLVYVHDAVLVGVVDVEDPSLEFEPGAIPHVTLMVKPPFPPSRSRGVVAAAGAAGLLAKMPAHSWETPPPVKLPFDGERPSVGATTASVRDITSRMDGHTERDSQKPRLWAASNVPMGPRNVDMYVLSLVGAGREGIQLSSHLHMFFSRPAS